MARFLPQLKLRNAPWTPLQRRTWLANRRKHRLLPAPVLRPFYPSLLQWDWDLADPYKWNVWQSMDGGVSYFLVGGYWMYGNARQFAPDGGGELHYIVGVDTNGKEITRHSNAVRPDDAPAPVPNAPATLDAFDNGTLIELTWQDLSSDELGFRIYRKLDAGAFALWRTVGPNVTLTQDSSVVVAILYSYYVTAYNAIGESAPSNIASARFGA